MNSLPIILLVLSLLIDVVVSQQLINLNTFHGGNVKNLITAHAPYDVFVSATSADMDILNQIWLISQDGKNITLHQLKNRKPFLTTSQIQPWPIANSAYVITSLSDDVMKELTGMMYISTTNQLQVNNFHVIDVDKAQNLYLPNENQTVLFLNSNMATVPYAQSTTINAWNQNSTSSIFFYKGIPTDLPEKNSSFFFSNPVRTAKGSSVFIPHVEPISLSLGAFYIKYYGGVSFSITPEYYDVNESTTQSFTTTGFYMKPMNQLEKNVTINTIRDPAYFGVTGNNLVGTVPINAKVVFGVHDGTNFIQNTVRPVDQILGFSTDTIGQDIQIGSANGPAGEYFLQYYVIPSPTVVTIPYKPTRENSINLAFAQLAYGAPSIALMTYLLVFLGVNKKYINSFYRLVQMDLLTNIICWLNTWISLRSLDLPIGDRYLIFLEEILPGIWNVSTFLLNFFFHMQFCSAASMSVHRISAILYYTQYNRFWSRWYLLIGVFFIGYSCLTQIGGLPTHLEVLNGTIYLTTDSEILRFLQKKLLVFGVLYFILLVVLGVTVARIALRILQGATSDQGVSKKLTRIALTYAIVYSGIPIWTLLNSISAVSLFLSRANYTLLSIVSDMITLSLPYILIYFDSNVQQHILHLKNVSGFSLAQRGRSVSAM
ncbi:hypothetical protein CAEBREN_19759 [Caenorhabditis brenneri]|uniref:Serpentine receptor class gamma n=1 Tax=Caenorhabditis brenneri TaxID=135651 RepID=G0M8W5_CAEBE|nr:hypothetical protein CAEBREN_19759 [Caenorhabditis brenneri]